MTKNVGDVDQTVRFIVAIVLLSMVLLVDSDRRWLGLVGLVPLLTGLTRVCPLYSLIGINTCAKESNHV